MNEPAANPADNRREPRFEVANLVPATWPAQPTPLFCPVTDISANGLFLEMPDPPAVQTQITVGAVDALARGRVVFVLNPSQAHQLQRRPGVGVQLDSSIDPDSFLLRCRAAEAEDRARRALEALAIDDLLDDDEPAIPLPPPSAIPLPPPSAIPLPPPSVIPLPPPSAIPLPSSVIPLPSATIPLPSSATIPLPSATIPLPSAAIPLPSDGHNAAALVVDDPADELHTTKKPPPAPMTTPTPAPMAAPVLPASPVRPAGATVMTGSDAVKRARKQVVAEARSTPQPLPLSEVAPPPPSTAREVVLVDGVDGQSVLAQALALDDYTVLVARHSLEALALTLKKHPALVVVGRDAERLGGRLFVDEVRRHPALVGVHVVLVDGSDDADASGARRWRHAPADVQRARMLIDEAVGAGDLGEHAKSDARDIAALMVALGQRLHAADEIDAAVSALRYAAELAPTVGAHTLALARVLLGGSEAHRAEASALIERVARQETRNGEANYLRAVALDLRGQKEDAKKQIERALHLSPKNEEYTRGLELLAAGTPLLQSHEAPAKRGFFSWLQGLFRRS